MRKNYDFSKGKVNPYSKRVKKSINIRVDEQVLEYFQRMAEKEGVAYQTLINSFLVDCAKKKKQMHVEWE